MRKIRRWRRTRFPHRGDWRATPPLKMNNDPEPRYTDAIVKRAKRAISRILCGFPLRCPHAPHGNFILACYDRIRTLRFIVANMVASAWKFPLPRRSITLSRIRWISAPAIGTEHSFDRKKCIVSHGLKFVIGNFSESSFKNARNSGKCTTRVSGIRPISFPLLGVYNAISILWQCCLGNALPRTFSTSLLISLAPNAGVWARAFEADVRNIRCARQGILTTCT